MDNEMKKAIVTVYKDVVVCKFETNVYISYKKQRKIAEKISKCFGCGETFEIKGLDDIVIKYTESEEDKDGV